MSRPPETPRDASTPEPEVASWDGVSAVLDETFGDAGATVSTTVPPDLETSPTADAAVERIDAAVAGDAVPTDIETPATAAESGVEVTAAPVVPAPDSDVNAGVSRPRWQPGELKLVIEQGMSVGKAFLISEADMLVGRRDPDQQTSPDIDLFDQEVPSNRYISRRQARLFFVDGQLMLEDLDSSNGTALNGHLVAPHDPRALAVHDKVHFGQSVLLRLMPL